MFTSLNKMETSVYLNIKTEKLRNTFIILQILYKKTGNSKT